MLKVFRDNLKNLAWILWVIIALFVLALAVDFGASSGGRGTGPRRPGGRRVGVPAEFQRAYQNMTNFYRQIYGEQFTPEGREAMSRQALSRTVMQKILLAEARRQGLRVTDAELRDRILSIPDFKDEQGRFIGEEIYKQTLAANQISVADFETELREEVLMKKLNDALAANLYVSEDEIQQAYRNQVERAKIRYVQLPRGRFAAQVPVKPQNRSRRTSRPTRRSSGCPSSATWRPTSWSGRLARQPGEPERAGTPGLLRRPQGRVHPGRPGAGPPRPGDGQRPAHRRAAQARDRGGKETLEGGADFAAVAREDSDDTASKDKGGDLGFFGRNRMVKEFEDAAFGAQPGKLVGPVKSSFGYHLVQVAGKRPGGTQPFELVKEQIRGRLTAERTRAARRDPRQGARHPPRSKDKPGQRRGPEDASPARTRA